MVLIFLQHILRVKHKDRLMPLWRFYPKACFPNLITTGILDWGVFVGNILCIVGHLTASLTSAHWMPAVSVANNLWQPKSPDTPDMNVSRETSPQLRSTIMGYQKKDGCIRTQFCGSIIYNSKNHYNNSHNREEPGNCDIFIWWHITITGKNMKLYTNKIYIKLYWTYKQNTKL